MEQLTIDDIKAIELEIMDEIDRVCAERGLQYFLGYGSLLGAVRHGGFIPWDDDIDILMMRADYEQLMAHFNEWRKSERFKLVSYRDESSIYQIAKVVDTTTVMYENFVGKKAATGVWVDIFPLENFDPTKSSLIKTRDRVGLLRSFVVTDPASGSNAFVKLVKRIVCPFVAHKNPYELAKRLDDIALEMNGGASGAPALASAASGAPEAAAGAGNAAAAASGAATPASDGSDSDRVIDMLGWASEAKAQRKCLFEPVRMAFEDRRYWAPAGYEEYLSVEYGDWRTPPAENNRPIHTMEAYRL